LARIDYLLSRLNLNSTQFDSLSSSNETPELDAMMVNAALGMGNLSDEAELIGRAIHMKDDVARSQIGDLSSIRIRQMFKEHNWSSTRQFQTHIKDSLANGSITLDQVDTVKAELAGSFYTSLGSLAISELAAYGDCLTCDGRGYLRNRQICTTCKGKRKHPWTEKFKAMFCVHLSIHAWQKTWKDRYQIIYLEMQLWLIEFEEHLVRYCR